MFRPRWQWTAPRRWIPGAPITNDLTATGSLSITGSAILTGIEEIVAAGSLSITGAADLDATGALNAAGSLSITGAADLDALGNLAATGSLSITGAADLIGLGTNDISAAGSLSIIGSAALTAIGELFAAGSIVITGAAQLTGAAERSLGGGRRKLRRRLFVDIDGQSFPVTSVAEAYAILESARTLAEQQAAIVARKAVRRALRKQQAPQPILPVIVVPQEFRTELQPLREQILALYQQALTDEEIRIRLERNARAEDEEDVLSLLLM